MTDGQRRWPKAVMLLQAEIDRQILADGGHVSRNPSLVMTLLRDLIALRDLCRQAAVPPPPAVTQAIDRMAPMLRFFRHGDGGLALFHGGGEEAPEAVELTLALAEADGKPIASAVHSGFERLAAHRALVLVDTGLPPIRVGGARPHFGLLAFEFSSGADRIVVNCGAPESTGGGWARALATTAAHSTLTLADTNALDPNLPDGRLAKPRVERSEQDGNIWLSASHDGYGDTFRFCHRRRLYLAANGEDLRGEDALVGYGASRKTPLALRFHLHPGLQASLLQNGHEVLLKCASGQGWRFRVVGPAGAGWGALSLADSVYFGQGALRRCQQIVVTFEASHGGATMKWAFGKVTAGR
jgi:uncharacterized heparinase superfamily protein